jgi:uncharacterized protein YjiS (DUF1127 family)
MANMDWKQPVGGDSTARHTARPRRGMAILSAGSRVLNFLYLWQARIDERRELACVDERLLKDAGITRADVMQEASKPFWRA